MTRQNPLEYLRTVVEMNYGIRDQFLQMTGSNQLNNPENKERLKERLESILSDLKTLRVPTKTLPVEIFVVSDYRFMTGEPLGYVKEIVNIQTNHALEVYIGNFINWLDKRVPERTRVASGKFLVGGFCPSDTLRQYVSD